MKFLRCYVPGPPPGTSIDNRAVGTHTSSHSSTERNPCMVTTWWSPQLNALLGSLVVAAGAWLAWGSFSSWGVIFIAGGAAGFLIWQGRTIGLVWAWATLLIGLESLAWPINTMVQVRSISAEPTDEQMETILSAVLTGLLSAVFWITLAYGLFKRAGQPIASSSTEAIESQQPALQSEPERPEKPYKKK